MFHRFFNLHIKFFYNFFLKKFTTHDETRLNNYFICIYRELMPHQEQL
jgi:hypothetical protein